MVFVIFSHYIRKFQTIEACELKRCILIVNMYVCMYVWVEV